MVGLLALLFVAVPFVELFVIIQVGQAVGVLPTLAMLIVVSVVGAKLVKREGLGVWRRANERLQAGQMPGKELLDGVMILFAGALLLTPGFISDLVGILLLLPPVRAGLRTTVAGMLAKRAHVRIGRIGGPW